MRVDWMMAGALALGGAGCVAGGAGQGATAAREVVMSEVAQAYDRQCRAEVESARQELARLQQPPAETTVAGVLEPLNELHRLLADGLGLAELYREVHPDGGVRAAATGCEQELKKVATELDMSRPVFESVRSLDREGLDADTRFLVDRLLRDFRRSGVDKDQPTRERIRALQQELVRVGQEFGENIRSDVRIVHCTAEELVGLPPDFVAAHPPGEDGRSAISTDYPDYVPFMTYARSDEKRRELYLAFRNRGWPGNREVLARMLAIRAELAGLLGYPTWADHATEDKMIGTAQHAEEFIERMVALAKPRARRDYAELLTQLRRESPSAAEVGDWQKAFLEEQVKRDSYALDSQQVRPYFSYRRVKQGLLDLVAELFGVEIRQVATAMWHPSVEAYELWQAGTLRGRFYLDMHPRPDKYKHAAAFPIRPGVAGRQVPEAALVCNFPGGDAGPDWMDHDSVQTLFHEFGHLLHHLFAGQQRWVLQSGIATEWDFVEVPSQLFEEWTWEPAVLQRFARNDAGEPIPLDLIAKMRRARDFGLGTFVRHQMFYAALSLQLHRRDPAGLDVGALVFELQRAFSDFAPVAGTHMEASFGHLFGYSATYYTYMWSLVIAKDLFAVIAASGAPSPEAVARYRRAVLEPGGSKPAAELVRAFLGRDFSFEAFERWLQGSD